MSSVIMDVASPAEFIVPIAAFAVIAIIVLVIVVISLFFVIRYIRKSVNTTPPRDADHASHHQDE